MHQSGRRTKFIFKCTGVGGLLIFFVLTLIWSNRICFDGWKYPSILESMKGLHKNAMVNYRTNHISKANGTILMGQFNYPSRHTGWWSRIWSKTQKFTDIFIAIPNQTVTGNKNCLNFMTYKPDKGFVSPYFNLGQLLQMNPSVRKVLYVHDDLLMTGSALQEIGGTKWIISDELGIKTVEKMQVK